MRGDCKARNTGHGVTRDDWRTEDGVEIAMIFEARSQHELARVGVVWRERQKICYCQP